MRRSSRRGSYPTQPLPSSWHELVTPLACDFITGGGPSDQISDFWLTWSLVCREWNEIVATCRPIAEERLICDSSMSLRIKLWKCVLAVPHSLDGAEFTSLLLEGSYSSWSEISRDSRRTYGSILRRRPDLHLQLTRILHALTTRFRDVGYCQGMNFVAGTVLLAVTATRDPSVLVAHVLRESSEDDVHDKLPLPTGKEQAPDSFMSVIQSGTVNENEVVAFKLCEKLFLRNHFVRMYELGLHTRLTIWTFDKLVESLFPALHDIITNGLQVAADFYASTWFITLFSADLDLRSSVRILDLFVAKGPKSLHRFGLACLASQMVYLTDPDTVRDPAEGLKILRQVAVAAVKEVGVETLIHRAQTEFKVVTNRLVADLQTTGKVHGGAQLMVYTDKDTQRRAWLVVPMPTSDSADDASPSGAAFEAEWNKEEAAIKQEKSQQARSSFLDRLKIRRSSVQNVASIQVDEDDADVIGLTGRGHSASPEHKERVSHRSKATKAFKSFKKKLGAIMPSIGTKGYSRGGNGMFGVDD